MSIYIANQNNFGVPRGENGETGPDPKDLFYPEATEAMDFLDRDLEEISRELNINRLLVREGIPPVSTYPNTDREAHDKAVGLLRSEDTVDRMFAVLMSSYIDSADEGPQPKG